MIQGLRQAEISLVAEECYPFIITRACIEHIPRLIRRCIIDDDEFKIGERLRRNAANRLLKVAGTVVHAHDDTHLRRGSGS